jgi:5-methylcytosine-specific restriction endonuclease McrA
MANTKTLTCNICGKPGYAGKNSKPQGKYRCHPCRRAHRPVKTCAHCGVEYTTAGDRYCSRRCFGLSIRADETTCVLAYGRRSRDVIGLSEHGRRNLLHKWQRQGRTCMYCPGPAETVDHVIALRRGGTNQEGNLVPACRQCNASKRECLLMEWRLGKRPSASVSPRPAKVKPAKVPELRLVLDVACYICGQVFTPKSKRAVACSPSCSYEHAKRSARNAYRRQQGLPEDWTTPSGQLSEYVTRKRAG